MDVQFRLGLSAAEYREAILAAAQVEHLTVEVGRCPHHEAA